MAQLALEERALENREVVKFVIELAFLASMVVYFVRSTGRRSASVARAPLQFLITRRPVLIVWALGTVGAMALFVPLGLAKGAQWALFSVPFSAFLGLGVATLVVGPAFVVMRAFKTPPDAPLEPGEVVVRTLMANHFLHGEARGGTLRVTNRRLVFRPHRYNVQLTPWALPLSEVRALSSEGTNLLLVNPHTADEQILAVQRAPRESEILRGIVAQPESERRPPD
jgi:hypothetical protein